MSKDLFKEMWDIQQAFAHKTTRYFRHKSIDQLTDADRVEEVKEYALGIVGEVKEVLDTLSWKRHRDMRIKDNRRNTLEEVVDVQKYLWGLMGMLEVTPEELHQAFIEKSTVVEHRWNQDKGETSVRLAQAKKIAIVDIDGVLNNYPQCFTTWARMNGEYEFSLLTKQEDLLTWSRVKHEYRISGAKRTQTVRNGAHRLLEALRDTGHFVIITTNRPVEEYPSLYFDTISWLRDNSLRYDYIYFADVEDKYVYLENILPKIKIVIDDQEDILKPFNGLGIRTYNVTLDLELIEVAKDIEYDIRGIMQV